MQNPEGSTFPISSAAYTRPLSSVAIVGLGYVGLPLALLAARKGYDVLGLDIDERKAANINSRVSPFLDEAIHQHLQTTTLRADTDLSRVSDRDIVILCVPTPVAADHSPDLGPLEGATRAVAPHLKRGALLVVESTVNPGICDNIVLPILEASGRVAGVDFHLSHCPERINPGDAAWNVETINRVAGSNTTEGLERTLAFYRSIITGDVRPMGSLKEAEAVKIVENTFRDINIAFVNELAMSFDKLGIDVMNVIEGASTKPFAFMPHFPSCGVGGHCIPVDPYYLIAEGKRNGFSHEFLSLARKINNHMPAFTVDVLERALSTRGETLSGERVAVLGLAYKSDIDDVRESPSYRIMEVLEERGASAVAFDPYVADESHVASIAEALQGSRAAIIATAHAPFRALTPRDFLDRGVSVVVDGKNCLPKADFLAAGVLYKGIGR